MIRTKKKTTNTFKKLVRYTIGAKLAKRFILPI